MQACTAILQSTKVHKEGQQHKSIILTVHLVRRHMLSLCTLLYWAVLWDGRKAWRHAELFGAASSTRQIRVRRVHVSRIRSEMQHADRMREWDTEWDRERENKRLHFKSSMVSASVDRAVGDSCRKDRRNTQHRRMKGKPTGFPHYLTWTGNSSTHNANTHSLSFRMRKNENTEHKKLPDKCDQTEGYCLKMQNVSQGTHLHKEKTQNVWGCFVFVLFFFYFRS